MRQILFQIPLNLTIPLMGQQIPVFGLGLLLAVWAALCVWWTFQHVRRVGVEGDLIGQLVFEAIVAGLIWKLPKMIPVINIYGYGAAMVMGFLSAAYLAVIRAKREGIDPVKIWDISMTVLFSGVIGARMFWVFQNAEIIFKPGRKVQDVLFDIVNLPNGGLVFYGGVMLGIVGYVLQCRRFKLSTLTVADILIASIFVGEIFGRFGCFLNGCCYGMVVDGWSWPWAVQFPSGSPAFIGEVDSGSIVRSATCSLPLLPTQIYSSICGLFLALLTWFYYPYRSRNGEVLLLGWLLYPITRFCLEIVRDEPRRASTSLTIAQEISILLFISGLCFAWYLSTQPRLPRPVRPAEEDHQ